MQNFNCSKCDNFIPLHYRIIYCDNCQKYTHVKCAGINHKTYKLLGDKSWNCESCRYKNLNHTLQTGVDMDDQENGIIYENIPENNIYDQVQPQNTNRSNAMDT